MGTPRTVYGLCGPDGVIVYVGSTMLSLKDRRRAHLQAARGQGDSPAQQWIRETGVRRVRIVSLIEHGNLADERAEIARRLALNEPLLNVRDGGSRKPTQRLALKCRADAERHARSADGDLPVSIERAAGNAKLPGAREWLTVQRAIKAALKPIRPREPLHPNEWRASHEAAAQPEQLRRAS
jgi:ribosomal protein L19E